MDKAFRAALLPFILAAAVGFILSLAAHIRSLQGLPTPAGNAVWSLHIGVFIVALPLILVMHLLTRGTKQKDIWKIALIGCPKWMRQALYVIVAYAIANFIYFAATINRAQPSGDAPPAVIRGFSGHWIVFYAVAFATLYSAYVVGYSGMRRKCVNGHIVSLTARFCEECGAEIEPFRV